MRECKWMGRRSRQWSAPNQEYKQRNTHNIWVDVERGQERMGRWNQIQFHLKHVNVLLSQRASRWHAITFPDMRVACMCVAVDIRYMHVKVPQTFSSRVKRCIAKEKKIIIKNIDCGFRESVLCRIRPYPVLGSTCACMLCIARLRMQSHPSWAAPAGHLRTKRFCEKLHWQTGKFHIRAHFFLSLPATPLATKLRHCDANKAVGWAIKVYTRHFWCIAHTMFVHLPLHRLTLIKLLPTRIDLR